MKRTALAFGALAVLALAARADTQYYRDLEMKDVASWGDVLRAGYILHTGKNEAKTFEEYRAYAIEHGIIPEGWADIASDSPVSKGRLAYVVVGALDIKGGVWLTVLGRTQRYAYREATHLGLMGKASPHRYIGGKELLSVLRRGMEYRRANAE